MGYDLLRLTPGARCDLLTGTLGTGEGYRAAIGTGDLGTDTGKSSGERGTECGVRVNATGRRSRRTSLRENRATYDQV